MLDWDGALRDIYVFDTDERDWDSLLTHLRRAPRLQFTIDGLAAQLPSHASDIFALRETARPLLVIDDGRLRIHTHFFVPYEIEFDLDPRQLNGPRDLDGLFDFMHGVSGAVRKPAVLTYENLPEHPYLRFHPGPDRPEYLDH